LQFIDHRALIGQDPETSRGENQADRAETRLCSVTSDIKSASGL
jgi:hypothetical protein